MGWTKEQIDEIASECFANDVKYDLAALQSYDEDAIREYFENGGSDEAPPPPEVLTAKSPDCWSPLPEEIKWRTNGTVAVITLNRPNEKNALDGRLSFGLEMCIERVRQSVGMRVLFLTGAGAMFCAGGDPKAFQEAAAQAKEAAAAGVVGGGGDKNATGAKGFAAMLASLASLPVYVVALCNGTAMGGGIGLLCCCDCVIAKRTAMFALSEVKLGVIPATISPYVVARIGVSNSRRLFMTGEAITSETARQMGLVNEVVGDDAALLAEAKRICKLVTLAAPGAAAAAKLLVTNVANKVVDEALVTYTAGELARVRMSDECAAGMVAVQAGQKPPWAASEVTLPED